MSLEVKLVFVVRSKERNTGATKAFEEIVIKKLVIKLSIRNFKF